jgi:chemotaxis-related protein WspB
MLFILFQIGADRYALEAAQVVEVLPLVELAPVAAAPPGVAGLLNYRGRPVLAVDLCALSRGGPASRKLSTRIILVRTHSPDGAHHLLGLIAEQVTQMLRKEASDFVNPGPRFKKQPLPGPMFFDASGPIQWIQEQQLLTPPLRQLLASHAAAAPSPHHAASTAAPGA